MKNNIIVLTLMLCAITALSAQNQRADTINLSIYNTGMRFWLTQAEFGGKVTENLFADMVMVYDTIILRKETGNADTTGRKPKRFVVEHRCDKPFGNLKNKIAIMELNKDCDVTQTCFNVQRAGAKAFIIIHNSNSNDDLKLPKKGLYKDSIRIPCYAVPNKIGDSISMLLPTKVGIKVPSISVTQNLIANIVKPNDPLKQREVILKTEQSSDQLNLNALEREKGLLVSKPILKLSPNPTHDIAYLNYGFSEATDFHIAVKNAVGQVIFTQILRGYKSAQ